MEGQQLHRGPARRPSNRARVIPGMNDNQSSAGARATDVILIIKLQRDINCLVAELGLVD